MIKFVCSSCGERLSVPDLHGGRKGVCPSCHAVNRIPLKGFAETQPRTPVVARPDGGLATQARETAAASTTVAPSSKPPKSNRAPDARLPEPAKPDLVSDLPRSPAPAAESFLESTLDDSPSTYAPITKERRLPKKLKVALLILAALAVVAALYFALYFALQTLIGKSE